MLSLLFCYLNNQLQQIYIRIVSLFFISRPHWRQGLELVDCNPCIGGKNPFQ